MRKTKPRSFLLILLVFLLMGIIPSLATGKEAKHSEGKTKPQKADKITDSKVKELQPKSEKTKGKSRSVQPKAVKPQPMTGAIWTTNKSGKIVNGNLYLSKDDVYLNSGPRKGSKGLPNATYYIQVTDPSGKKVLGKSKQTIQVTNGKIGLLQLSAILYTKSSNFQQLGFDNTPNPGGVYKVWLSLDPQFSPKMTKTDNFKVKIKTRNNTNPRLSVIKFYDTNVNGIYDQGDFALVRWKVNILGTSQGTSLVGDVYTPWASTLNPGTYTIQELMPNQDWVATTPISFVQNLKPGDNKHVSFGNVFLGAGGGHTKGFWSNNNGNALVDNADLNILAGLSLSDKNGNTFDPTTYEQFKIWLSTANANNMSYMLSAQLAAMKLNVLNGFVIGNHKLWTGTYLGFLTVNELMDKANLSLQLNSSIPPVFSTLGDYQEYLKEALDIANNNKNFIQALPGEYHF